jgi:hypothetical protein
MKPPLDQHLGHHLLSTYYTQKRDLINTKSIVDSKIMGLSRINPGNWQLQLDPPAIFSRIDKFIIGESDNL